MVGRGARRRSGSCEQEGRLSAVSSRSPGPAEGLGDLALPSPGAARRYLQAHPWVTDGLVAGFCLAVLAFGLTRYATPIEQTAPIWVALVTGLACVAAVLTRRVLTWPAFSVACLLLVWSFGADSPLEPLAVLLLVYALGVYRSTRAAWLGFGLAALASMLGPYLEVVTAEPTAETVLVRWLNVAVPSVVLLIVATLLGTNVGGRKAYVAALVDRAGQLARERDQQAEIASARERERIAREMHDVIAHSLSVMIALAEGAAATSDRQRSKEAIGAVAETGRRTLGEVRRLLSTVRADGGAGDAAAGGAGARVPQPRAEDLPTLVAEFSRAGLPVSLATTGTPGADPALGLTVYRIVQESLTNVLRHARGVTRVAVAVGWRDDEVSVVVDDDGLAGAPSDGGRGLVGMRERAALYRGAAEAGPRGPHGWSVRVLLRREVGTA